jgi:uracil phosphoribosyltransferase
MKGVRKSAVIFAMALFALVVFPQRSPAAAPAGGEAPGPAKMEAKSGCPCDCDCGACGHMRGGHGKHPMMEGMKKHMEEVRKSVAALREHENKMEGITDPAQFRKAAMEHFRMLDDLNESHVKHMDSMMGGGGHEHHHQ